MHQARAIGDNPAESRATPLRSIGRVANVSATLVVWASAWRNGSAASDDVLDALQVWADAHGVCAADPDTAAALELPLLGEPPAAPALLLAALRGVSFADAGIVLPIPGDVRGLGGKSSFAEKAMQAGEAVLLGEAGYGIVPDRVSQDEIQWTVYRMPAITGRELTPLSQAEHDLSGSMRSAATALVELGVAKAKPNVREEIAAMVERNQQVPWPEGMPQRALRVLQRAAELDAILHAASGDQPGGALSSRTARAREEVLAPLAGAVRSARCAAVDEAARMLSDEASEPSSA